MMKNTKFARRTSPESFEAPESSRRELNLARVKFAVPLSIPNKENSNFNIHGSKLLALIKRQPFFFAA